MDSLSNDLDWLRKLDDEIGELVKGRGRAPSYYQEKRRISGDELNKIFQIVLSHNLPVQMGMSSFGFGCGIGVFEPPPKAPCPGIEPKDLKPPCIFWVTKDHLPLSEAHGEMKDRTTFEDGWRVFSQLSHREENKKLCENCGIEGPKPKVEYEY